MSYIVLGHGSEHLEKRDVVPAGCMYIVSEECGIEGTIPHFLYDVFSDPGHAELLNNPLAHRAALEKLFKKRLTIYKEGDSCPHIEYTLLGYGRNTDQYDKEDAFNIEPSGVYSVPASRADWLIDGGERGIKRWTQRIVNPMKPAEIRRTFQGAVYPPIDGLATKAASVHELGLKESVRISQENLFKLMPGIYYNFLCRSVLEEQELTNLIYRYFPNEDLFSGDGHDHIVIIEQWFKGLKKKQVPAHALDILKRIKDLIKRVKAQRRMSRLARGYSMAGPIDKIVNLLGASRLAATTIRLIETLDDALLNNVNSHDGYTILTAAAANGHTNIVKQLLARGADPNIADIEETTPLMLACSRPAPDIVALLVRGGANVNLVDNDGDTALHVAVTMRGRGVADMIKGLIAGGADVNARDADGNTPIHMAGGHNHVDYLRLLVAAGGDINAQNKLGLTPLMDAISERTVPAIDYLVGRSDLSLRSVVGSTALSYALKAKMDGLAKKLILLGAPVSKWGVLRDAARVYKLADLAAFVTLVTRGLGDADGDGGLGGLTSAERRAAIQCLMKGRVFETRRCLKPCATGFSRDKQTRRCRKIKIEVGGRGTVGA